MLIRDENGDPYCLKYCKEVKHRELCVIYCEHYDSLRSTNIRDLPKNEEKTEE